MNGGGESFQSLVQSSLAHNHNLGGGDVDNGNQATDSNARGGGGLGHGDTVEEEMLVSCGTIGDGGVVHSSSLMLLAATSSEDAAAGRSFASTQSTTVADVIQPSIPGDDVHAPGRYLRSRKNCSSQATVSLEPIKKPRIESLLPSDSPSDAGIAARPIVWPHGEQSALSLPHQDLVFPTGCCIPSSPPGIDCSTPASAGSSNVQIAPPHSTRDMHSNLQVQYSPTNSSDESFAVTLLLPTSAIKSSSTRAPENSCAPDASLHMVGNHNITVASTPFSSLDDISSITMPTAPVAPAAAAGDGTSTMSVDQDSSSFPQLRPELPDEPPAGCGLFWAAMHRQFRRSRKYSSHIAPMMQAEVKSMHDSGSRICASVSRLFSFVSTLPLSMAATAITSERVPRPQLLHYDQTTTLSYYHDPNTGRRRRRISLFSSSTASRTQDEYRSTGVDQDVDASAQAPDSFERIANSRPPYAVDHDGNAPACFDGTIVIPGIDGLLASQLLAIHDVYELWRVLGDMMLALGWWFCAHGDADPQTLDAVASLCHPSLFMVRKTRASYIWKLVKQVAQCRVVDGAAESSPSSSLRSCGDEIVGCLSDSLHSQSETHSGNHGFSSSSSSLPSIILNIGSLEDDIHFQPVLDGHFDSIPDDPEHAAFEWASSSSSLGSTSTHTHDEHYALYW